MLWTSSDMTNFKPFFSKNLSIFFWSDANILTSICLVYFRSILNYPWSYSVGRNSAKNTDWGVYIMAIGIGNTCARNTDIGSTYTVGTWIRCSSVGSACIRDIYPSNASVRDVEPRILVSIDVTSIYTGVNVLAEPEMTLEDTSIIFMDASINNCCF